MTDFDAICRRAGGRRRYNAQRRTVAIHRRVIIAQRLAELGQPHGVQAELARELKVSATTVCRDLKAMNAESADRGFKAMLVCPYCGALRQGAD